MTAKNFVIKNGLTVGDSEVIDNTGAVTADALGTDVSSFTTTNARSAISVTGSATYNSSTGEIHVNGDVTSVNSLTGDVTLDTDDITEANNLYFTQERTQDVVGAQLATNGDHTGISFSYDDAGDGAIDATVSLSPFSTTNLSEGTNLYFTNERVDDRVNSLLTAGTGITLTYDDDGNTLEIAGSAQYGDSDVESYLSGGTGVSFSSGVISIGQDVDTSSNVTFNQVTADLNGNASTADALSTARTISGVSFDGSANITLTSTNIGEGTNLYFTDERVDDRVNDLLQGGTVISTSYNDGANTLTVDHDDVSRSNTTDTPAQMAAQDTFEAITSVTTSEQGHVTGVETTTYQLPPSAVPNDATITISAGTNLTTGGNFTTDQGTNETITINMDSDIHVDSVTSEYIDLDTPVSAPSHAEGRIFYDTDSNALAVYNDESEVTLQVGQEEWIRVYNNSGATLTNGTPMYATGSSGNTMTVAAADATTEDKSRVIALATHDIENNSYGYGTVRGFVNNVDTSSLTAGDEVHISPTGGYQTAAPTYPYFPTEIGTCVVSNATTGRIYVRIVDHVMEQLRVTSNTHMDGNLTVDGDLTVNGTQTITNQANLAVSDASIYLNSGDTIGETNTTFSGTGLDDAYFSGHYNGTTSRTFYVRIDSVGGGTGGVDTFEWSYDDFSTTEATDVDLDDVVELEHGISITFNATTGHTLNDKWSGSAAPVNVDSGWASNRNTGTSGVGYTHMGVFFDISDEKFKFYEEYDPEPEGEINVGHASFNLGTVVADTFEGAFTGDLTGTASNATTAVSLTGLTSTIAELNYLDGVTSNVQTQLDGKMASTATLDTVADNGATTNQTLTVGGISTTGNISADEITTSHTSNSGGVARNIYQSTSAPTSGDGAIGDLWILYS